MRILLAGLVISVVAVVGCGSDAATEREPALSAFVDLDPAPDAVEVDLIAEPATWELMAGKPAAVWAFRDGGAAGSAAGIPGPLLDANQGDRVTVHFHNLLPEATTIHWHGVRVPNAADGTPVAQTAVEPGQDYDYVFTVEDAGLFWYHPHVAGDVQVERGLYGPLRVRGGVEPDVAADGVLVLDDVTLLASGELAETTDALDIMLGRQGNVLLVTGRQAPQLSAAAGGRERWRFVSAANGRYFNLDLPGRRFLVIGWDGGQLVEPYEVETLLIAPGERYDVLVDLGGQEGDALALRTIHYDRGHDIPDPGPKDLMTIALGAPGAAPADLPETWGEVAAITVDAATPQRSLILREDTASGPEPIFTINDERYPDITPITSSVDAVEIWAIENDTEMDHPFHLHGMSFQVLEATGPEVARLGWKDTVNVPREQIVRFAVQIGPPGRWMYHCHILEHAERGMMGELAVSAP